jgi:S-(hydroxymethyl)glutathione dehydrogenase/alcohol dehydrogenase
MAVAGVCHSDNHFATGDMVPTPELAALMEATGAPALCRCTATAT